MFWRRLVLVWLRCFAKFSTINMYDNLITYRTRRTNIALLPMLQGTIGAQQLPTKLISLHIFPYVLIHILDLSLFPESWGTSLQFSKFIYQLFMFVFRIDSCSISEGTVITWMLHIYELGSCLVCLEYHFPFSCYQWFSHNLIVNKLF